VRRAFQPRARARARMRPARSPRARARSRREPGAHRASRCDAIAFFCPRTLSSSSTTLHISRSTSAPSSSVIPLESSSVSSVLSIIRALIPDAFIPLDSIRFHSMHSFTPSVVRRRRFVRVDDFNVIDAIDVLIAFATRRRHRRHRRHRRRRRTRRIEWNMNRHTSPMDTHGRPSPDVPLARARSIANDDRATRREFA